MSARTGVARVALIAILVAASSLIGSHPARAAAQSITATILLASNGGGVARREWNASNGQINGVNGYVFAIDPATVGTYFNLNLASSNSGVGAPSIAFYVDMVNGITCSSFDGSPGAAGVVCGDHAIVYTLSGANLTFTYQSGLPVPPPPPFLASKFAFSAPIALPFAAGQTGGNIGEPSIDVDPANGNIYVTGPTGVPCGLSGDECVAFWRSTDGGTTFTQPAPTAFMHPLGGGDDDVIHDGLSNVFIDDLRSLVDTGVYRSTDRGNTWTSADTGPCSDRPWLGWGGFHAPTGPLTIYESQNSGACTPGALFQFWRSTDDGVTFLPVGFVNADLGSLGYTADSSVEGGVEAKFAVDQVSGAIYAAWATQAIQDGTNATTRLLLVGKSTDGGSTWHNSLVYSGPLGTSIQNLFPVIAVDHSGNVYAAFSTQLSNTTLMGVYMVSSFDGGKTWSAAQRVSPTNQTAVFPAVSAGDAGRVDFIWIGTSATSPSDPSAQWNIYFAQSRNANSGTPRWSTGQVSQKVMHIGDICNQGLNCNIFGGNRDLADFISVTVDADGNANAVWTDDSSQSPKAIMFAKQIGGPTTGKLPPRS